MSGSRNQEPLWTRNFVLGIAINFAIACNYFMLMVVMTAYALDTYQTVATLAALLASAFIIGTLVSRFLSALLMSSGKLKRLLLWGAVADTLLSALYLAPETLGMLIGLRFIHGMAYGICSTTIATVVTSIIPPARKGEGIGYYMLSVTLGAAIGPFLGIFLANNFGYQTLFIIALATAFLSIPCTAALTLSPRTQQRSALQAEEEAMDEAAAWESDAPAEATRELKAADSSRPAPMSASARATSRATAQATAPTPSGLRKFIEPCVIPISVVCGLIFFGYSSLLTFLTPYAQELDLSRAASVFFVVYALSMFITRPFTGRAFDRIGPRPVMTPAFFAFALGMVVLALASNDWMILGAAFLLGFGVGTIQSCGLSMAVKATPDERLSLANATFYILLDAGVGVGPVVLGALLPLMGYRLLYGAMALLGLGAFLLFLGVSARKKHSRAA